MLHVPALGDSEENQIGSQLGLLLLSFLWGSLADQQLESFVCPRPTFRPQVLPTICFRLPSLGVPRCRGATCLPGCAVSLSSFYFR